MARRSRSDRGSATTPTRRQAGATVILRRIGWAIVVVWFAVTAAFVMTAAIPADPAKAVLGPHATQESLARVRRHYCLDRGAIVQYGCWLDHVVHGDLG